MNKLNQKLALARAEKKSELGFSLVELSIVLIIIGLLVAGVSGGSKLIKNAKVQKAVSELTNINRSIKSFETTYGYLPGDFNAAATFFSTNSNCTTSATVNCNGDGDSVLESSAVASTTTASNGGESPMAFFHMSLAGVYEKGTFTPYSNTNSTSAVFAVSSTTAPTFDIDNTTGYYAIWGADSAAAEATCYNSSSSLGRYCVTMAALTTTTIVGAPANSALTGQTAYFIDKKLDDGTLTTGIILAYDGRATGVSTAANASTNCTIAGTTTSCRLLYLPDKS